VLVREMVASEAILAFLPQFFRHIEDMWLHHFSETLESALELACRAAEDGNDFMLFDFS